MQITQLGYIGIAATDVEEWHTYAADFLGLQVVDADGQALALRMDERWQRMLIEPSDHDGLAYMGFEVEDNKALHEAAETMKDTGVKITMGDNTECTLRHVDEFLWFHDPDGNRVELYCGPANSSELFRSPRLIGGFRTGELGLGHAVMQTNNFENMENFYRNTLGFHLSDFIKATPFRATFMHVNPRHHSFAIIEAPERRLHHIMIEYNYMDDVGRLYDMALAEPERVAVTLGRHSNDHVLSFYSTTPGGFMIETGWAGRLIDDNWKPEALYGPSVWGHERNWLPPEGRAAARRQREVAATQGILEPTPVTDAPGFDLDSLDK